MSKRMLITGGCGFIGSHVIEYFLKNTDYEILIFDKLTYAASGFDRMKEIGADKNDRVSIFTVDFTKEISDGIKKEVGEVNYILHLGAETHVDRSITNPSLFVSTNCNGTMHMLEYARCLKEKYDDKFEMFLYFSTDEVMGSAPKGVYYKETDTSRPENPYAAAKAAGENIAMAYACTYRIPLKITRTMNVFSKYQHQEKFIPGTIKKILLGEENVIHATPDLKSAGTRFYISAQNVAIAIKFVIDSDEFHTKENRHSGIFNIVGEREIDNLTLAKTLYELIKKRIPNVPDFKYVMTDHHSQRPGHDLRYALDGSKLKNMGFEYPLNLEQSLDETVEWYLNNKTWLGLD